MSKQMSRPLSALVVLALAVAMPATASVNKSIRIGAGETVDGASSVNGSVTVGTGAIVNGDVETVNGTVRIEDSVQVRDASSVNGAVRLGTDVSARRVETVNGSIRVGGGSTVEQSVTAVNGGIELQSRSRVGEEVSNVNGGIELAGAEVGANVETVSGDIQLRDGAVVRGDIVVRKPSGWRWKEKKRKPRIVIGPGSVVEGVIELEREVELFLSDTAQVGGVTGEMSLQDAERFSGDAP